MSPRRALEWNGPDSTYKDYDAAGNTLSYTGASFGFNQRGRMSSATVGSTGASYIYNALGQLIKKTVGGVTTLLMYDEAGHLLGEYSSTGALIQETVWMDNTPVATLRPNGSAVTIYYVHTDHLNAPRVVSQSSSDNSPRWLWGGNAANQNPLGLGAFTYNLRYPGQYFQAETGLSYNYFRDYDGVTGRYIESDPIGLGGGVNTYIYASDNPISRVDPFGLFSLAIGAQVSTVDDIPGNTWYGWGLIPGFGGNLIGQTKAYVPAAECKCKGCDSSWTLGECSAYVDIEVIIQAGLNHNADAFSRHAEGEHVTDLKAGYDTIRLAGAAAERAQQQRTFATQSDCELQSSNAVTQAVRAAVRAVSISSGDKDRNGSHTYPYYPF
jgi:RHS repeat-associated protein